jgi:hypothetical protein
MLQIDESKYVLFILITEHDHGQLAYPVFCKSFSEACGLFTTSYAKDLIGVSPNGTYEILVNEI